MVAMVAATFSIDFDCKGSNLVLINLGIRMMQVMMAMILRVMMN